MTSTSMMAISGLLEEISALKAATDKKVKDEKESSQKVVEVVCFYITTC